MSHTTTDPGPESDLLEPDWLAAPAHRSRGRVVLVVALAALLVFLGGVEVQKRWGAETAASSASLPALGSFPAGGSSPAFTGSGTPTQTEGGSDNGTGDGSDSGTDSSSSSGTTDPAVIGKLTDIKGHTWTVEDLGGKTHTVKVTRRTTVTRPIADASEPLHTGSSVTVTGTTHGRTVVATAVSVR